MGRSPGYTSPATRVRSLKRAIKYFKSKGLAKSAKVPDLAREICTSVDIPPQSTSVLTISVLPSVSISPNPMNHLQPEKLSLSKQPSVYKPSSNPGYLTLDLARQQAMLTKPHPAPDLLTCRECENIFETRDDMKWHQENKYGCEDCIILQKMMLSSYLSKSVI